MQGSIKDFSVADILQLMSQQLKTGILIVENNKQPIEIYFLNGNVAEIKSPNDTELLGAMLVKSQTITEEQLRTALAIQKNSFDNVCSILLRQGILNKEQFEHVITIYAYEIFYEILQWHSGTYQFVAQNTVQEPLIVFPGIQSILLDVLRMIDEWPAIKKIISSPDMLFDNNYAVLTDLDAEEERVCGLVDGHKSAQDIIDASLLGSFYTCKALVQLLERGAIRLLSSRAEKKPDRVGFIEKAAIAAASAVCLAVVLIRILLAPGSFIESTMPAAALLRPAAALHQAGVGQDLRKIEKALSIYFFETGKYPDFLAEVADKKILRARDIAEAVENQIAYLKTRGSYELAVRQ